MWRLIFWPREGNKLERGLDIGYVDEEVGSVFTMDMLTALVVAIRTQHHAPPIWHTALGNSLHNSSKPNIIPYDRQRAVCTTDPIGAQCYGYLWRRLTHPTRTLRVWISSAQILSTSDNSSSNQCMYIQTAGHFECIVIVRGKNAVRIITHTHTHTSTQLYTVARTTLTLTHTRSLASETDPPLIEF